MSTEEIEARRAARRAFDDIVWRARLGMSIEDVKAIMGEPAKVTTDVPEYVGWGKNATIQPDATPQPEPPDTFLTYLDPNRPRTVHYFRFRNGHLRARWKHTTPHIHEHPERTRP